MDFNLTDITKLAELLKPEESSSDSDDGLPKVGVSKFGPGHIGTKVKITGGGGGGDASESSETVKNKDKDIWDESEVPEGIEYDESEDPREKPAYEIKYKQSVSTEEMFLQMGNKTPATASCEDMVVEIKLPGEDKSRVDLNVVKQCLELRSLKFRLSLPLPHPVNPDSTKAVWDADGSLLTVTLRMDREFDFVNF